MLKKNTQFKLTNLHLRIIAMFNNDTTTSIVLDRISYISSDILNIKRSSFLANLSLLARVGILSRVNSSRSLKYKLNMTYKELEEKFMLLSIPDILNESHIETTIPKQSSQIESGEVTKKPIKKTKDIKC